MAHHEGQNSDLFISLQESCTPSSPLPLILPTVKLAETCESRRRQHGKNQNKQGLGKTTENLHLILMMTIKWLHGPGTKVGTTWTFQSQQRPPLFPPVRSEAGGKGREVSLGMEGQAGKKNKPRTLETKTHCRYRRRPLAFLGQDSMEHYGS